MSRSRERTRSRFALASRRSCARHGSCREEERWTAGPTAHGAEDRDSRAPKGRAGARLGCAGRPHADGFGREAKADLAVPAARVDRRAEVTEGEMFQAATYVGRRERLR